MSNELHTENRPHHSHADFQPNEIITTDDTLEEAAHKSRTGGNKWRKEEAELRTDYYYDQSVHSHIQNILDQQFADPAAMKHQISWRNIIKTIIRKTALVYKDAPVREIFVESMEEKEVPDPENEGETITEDVKVAIPSQKDQELWDEIEKATKLNILLKTVNRMTQLTRRVVVKVGFDKKKDRVKLSIILPNILDIIVDETDVLEPLAMFWNVGMTRRVVTDNEQMDNAVSEINAEAFKYEYWSTDSEELDEKLRGKNFIFNGKGDIPEKDNNRKDNPENENKVKDKDGDSIIPVVTFAAEMPVEDWFVGGGGDLINATETVNVLMTYLNYMVKLQSFSQPVARGIEAQEIKDPQGGTKTTMAIMTDPSMVIRLKETDSDVSPSTFEFVTPDAKIVDVKELIREKIIDIATDYAIAVQNFSEQSTPSSGIAIKLQNKELLDFRSDEIDLYRCSELELYEVVKAVQNTFSNRKFTEDSKMKTNFAEVKFPEEPKATLETLDLGIELGITSAVDFVMMQDPDLTEEEAEKKILENLKRRRQTGTNVPDVSEGILSPQQLNLNPNTEDIEDDLAAQVDPEQFTDSTDTET